MGIFSDQSPFAKFASCLEQQLPGKQNHVSGNLSKMYCKQWQYVDDLKRKHFHNTMSPYKGLLLSTFLFLSGVTVTCFVSYLPSALISLLTSERQNNLMTPAVKLEPLSPHETSMVYRVRQTVLPPNPGMPYVTRVTGFFDHIIF